MAEREAYLVASAHGAVQTISGRSRYEQSQPILRDLLGDNPQAARRVQEIHWHGGEDEYWLGRLGEADGFGPGLARFFWPVTPLLTHTLLHSAARAIESGERELIILAQESSGQAVILLLASRGAVEQYQLSPRTRIGRKIALTGGQDALLPAARSALESAGQDLQSLRLLGTARKLGGAEASFPGSDWVIPGPDLLGGDFFMLAAMDKMMEEKHLPAAALISYGSQKSGLLTVLERLS
jgi:hypothetical protein